MTDLIADPFERAKRAVPPRPVALKVIPEQVPEQMRAIPQWVGWRYFWKADIWKWDKPPVNVRTGGPGSSTNPDTWSTFDEAVTSYRNGGNLDGIGLVITKESGIVGIDLDHAVEGGDLSPYASDFLDHSSTYTELSPSGTGIHQLGFGSRPQGFVNRKGGGDAIEIYDSGRYLTVTGQWWKSTPDTVEPISFEWMTPPGEQPKAEKLYEVIQAGETIPEGQRQNAAVSLAGFYKTLRLDELLAVARMYHDRGVFPGRTWDYISAAATRGWQNYHSETPIPLIGPSRDRISPAELIAMDFPAEPWRVKGYILRTGSHVLAGEGGSGKTEDGLDAALGFSTGTTAFGQPVQGKGGVLYLGPDMDKELFRLRFIERCRGRGIEPPGRDDFLLDTSRVNLLDPILVDDIIATLKGINGTLLILDALYNMHPGKDSNKEEDMAEVMDVVRGICVEAGCASLGYQHWNKNTLTGLSNRGRGSGAIRDGCDIYMLALHKKSGDTERYYLAIDKTRIRPPAPTVEVKLEPKNGGVEMVFGKADDKVLEETLRKELTGILLDVMKATPDKEYTRDELEDVLKKANREAQRTCMTGIIKELKDNNSVRKGKRGHADLFRWGGEPSLFDQAEGEPT